MYNVFIGVLSSDVGISRDHRARGPTGSHGGRVRAVGKEDAICNDPQWGWLFQIGPGCDWEET